MAGLNMIGSYSGIDKSTIDQLMAAEKMPLVQLSNKKTTITEQQNAWKDINTRLNTLFEKVKALQKGDTFNVKSSSSTNDKNVSMTAGKSAVSGTYNIKVKQLATNTRIIGKNIASLPIDETTGKKDITKAAGIEGSFIIKNHDFNEGLTEEDKAALTVKIETTDSLKDITDKINSTTKSSGVSASIINNQLILTDNKTGARELELENIDVDGVPVNDTIGALGLATGPSPQTKGVQAIFDVNGIENITSDSNTVTGVVEAVTINLTKVHTGEEFDTVTISQDNTAIEKAVKEFVDQYNSTMTFIEDKLKAGDPKVPGSKGALSGDSSLMRLHSSLRNLVTAASPNDNKDIKGIKDISELGVTTIDKFGQLQFDSGKLAKALTEDTESVMNFFMGKNDNDFTPRLRNYIDIFSSKTSGIIKGKTESFEKTLKDLNTQIDNFNARMVKKEAYYVKMFTALDVAMMQAESQMSWLQGQVDSMNGIKR